MEDVLEVYQRKYAEDEVLVCMDETSKQHTKETRIPLPTQPGNVAKFDYEYERNGVSNLFMLFAPLEGWRYVKVTDRHTKIDWAELIKELVDEHYPKKRKIVLVMDNLNTHKLSSLYEAFEPSEARRIAERLEIHYTPKHGSWLDMAEIEIGVMARQCLDRRIEDQQTLRNEINAWQQTRNAEQIRVNWRFTTSDARIKLKSLYPSTQN
jgi:DDE superfamily endonuclease